MAAGHVVACFGSAEAFLKAHDPCAHGCLIPDLALPGLDGLALQESLSCNRACRPVIFLSGRVDVPSTVRAMKAGAVDFLPKPVDAPTLLGSVPQALARDQQLRAQESYQQVIDLKLARLTRREREDLDQVSAGQSNKQIAATLGTVAKTVKVHRGRMIAKMEVRTVADLVRLVASLGPVDRARAQPIGP